MSPEVTCTWAGRPSRIAASEGPWDSPAVSQRSMRTVFQNLRAPRTVGSVAERAADRRTERGAHQGCQQHVGPERVPTRVDQLQQRQQSAADSPEELGQHEPDDELVPAEEPEHGAEQEAQPDVAEAVPREHPPEQEEDAA